METFYKTWGRLQKDPHELESLQGQEWEAHRALEGDGIRYTF